MKIIYKLVTTMMGLCFIGIGLYLLLYSDINTLFIDYHTKLYIKNFKEYQDTQNQNNQNVKALLYQNIKEYNETIYENHQINFNENSLKSSPIDSDSLIDDEFGYIEIPTLNKTFPLYLGASDKNMAKGLAIMGQTSIPIGEKNTNSVIAGHRGWNTGNFLREIEKVKIGDYIYITNPWEKLMYQVIAIDIISPYDVEKLLIQEGKTMITIMTCHPYASHGKYRYLVYCEQTKKKQETIIKDDKEEVAGKTIVALDGTVYQSSKEELKKEEFMKKVCGTIIIGIMILVLLKRQKNKKRRKKGTKYA